MRFQVLGPLSVLGSDGPIAVGGPKERVVLAHLLAAANQDVSLDALIDTVWGDRPPRTAAKSLQTYVLRLRNALEPDRHGVVVTRGRGYRVVVDHDDLDATEFERMAAIGHRELRAGSYPAAAATLRSALSLWRGDPFPELAHTDLGSSASAKLTELRLVTLEHRVEAELSGEIPPTAVAELAELVAAHPLRERFWAQLMTAYYRLGRQAEALAAYGRARAHLADELGVEPGPELRDLHAAILRHEPELARPVQAEAVTVDSGRCPYPGLVAFDIDDAADFHGREHLVAQLVTQLAATRFLGVVGPSGSGKSSVVRAGLLAALRDGALPGSAEWPLTVIRPGNDPRAAVSQVSQVTGGVVFVDQFEELFTTGSDPGPFLDALLTDPSLKVIVAIRADYYGHCAAYPELAQRLAENHVLVGPMREAELVRAIERPARRVGVLLADGLADTLAGALVDRPGALPLLSATLRELWEQRADGTLTMRAYAEAGGVEGAVARLAERAYDRLSVPQQETARMVLQRLTGPGEGDEAVRRRVLAVELADLSVPDVNRVVEVFTEARVLTVGDGHIEMAHEALLRHWPRLRSWLEEDAEGRTLHRKLTVAAKAWLDGGREPGDLYRGARLVSVLDWAVDHRAELTSTESAFLCAARNLSEAEASRARARHRRLRLLALGLVVLLLAALAGAWLAFRSQRRADAASVAADARRLGAQALIERDIGLAMLLAVQAVRLDSTPQTRATCSRRCHGARIWWGRPVSPTATGCSR